MSAPESRPVDSLRPRASNAKMHTEEQTNRIAASIREFGFPDPIEIRPDGTILVGEGRWLAAKALAMDTVPVIVHEMSDADAEAYAIAHNQTTLLSGLDMSKVADEFSRIGVEENEYAQLGFSADEVIFMMPEQRDIMDDDSVTSPTMDMDAWADLVPKAIRTKLVFEGQLQQATFELFTEKLRELYPTEITLSDRMVRYIRDYAPASEVM